MSVSFANDGKGEGGWGVVDKGGGISVGAMTATGTTARLTTARVEQRESRDIRFNSPRRPSIY